VAEPLVIVVGGARAPEKWPLSLRGSAIDGTFSPWDASPPGGHLVVFPPSVRASSNVLFFPPLRDSPQTTGLLGSQSASPASCGLLLKVPPVFFRGSLTFEATSTSFGARVVYRCKGLAPLPKREFSFWIHH